MRRLASPPVVVGIPAANLCACGRGGGGCGDGRRERWRSPWPRRARSRPSRWQPRKCCGCRRRSNGRLLLQPHAFSAVNTDSTDILCSNALRWCIVVILVFAQCLIATPHATLNTIAALRLSTLSSDDESYHVDFQTLLQTRWWTANKRTADVLPTPTIAAPLPFDNPFRLETQDTVGNVSAPITPLRCGAIQQTWLIFPLSMEVKPV